MVTQSNIETTTSESYDPSSVYIEELRLVNMFFQDIDIRDSVVSLEITESLDLLSSICHIELVDGLEIFSKYMINGFERLFVTLRRKDLDTGNEIVVTKTYYITEIPNYGKPNPYNSVFSLVGVSEQAYLSKLQKVSSVHNGNVKEIIDSIFRSKLAYLRDIIIEGDISTRFKYISTFQEPLEICEILLSRSFGENSTPVYLYETISENYKLSTLNAIYEKEVYRNYEFISFIDAEPLTPEFYKESIEKIISINLDVSNTRYETFGRGALNSTQYHVDIKTGTHEKISIESYKNKKNLNKNFIINENLNLGNKKLKDYKDQSVYTILEYPTFTNEKNSNSSLKNNLNMKNSYIENMNIFKHRIEVYGDLHLNPGKKINLKLQRSKVLEENESEFDEYISGNYIISEVKHKITNKQYTCELEVFTDSTNKDLK